MENTGTMSKGLKLLNGDWVIEKRKLVLVDKYDKAKRDFHKFLCTDAEYEGNEVEYNRYNPNYGVALNQPHIFRGLDRDAILDLMGRHLAASIKNYVQLQETRQNLSTEEIIRDIKFTVFVDPTNRQKIKFKIELLMQGTSEYDTLGIYSQQVV